MQTYIVTWRFESSEDQTYASDALVEYFENGNYNQSNEGYERIAWVHSPQDGTGVIICKASSASTLYKMFSPWREKFGMIWNYKPGISTEELVDLIKNK